MVLLVWAFAVACSDTDVGHCCTHPDQSKIPVPEIDMTTGQPRNVIRLDLQFNCEDAWCVSYQGSVGFCTKSCEFNGGCPEGFECLPVIESDAGPDANVHPGDKFCVRKQTECLKN